MQILSTLRLSTVFSQPTSCSSTAFTGVKCPTASHLVQTPVNLCPSPAPLIADCSVGNCGILQDLGGPLNDGELVWYCGQCEDGPHGIWNPVCISCNHVRDGCCMVEEM